MSSNSTPDFGRILGVSPDEACLGYVYAYRRRCRNTIDSNGRRQIGECLRQGTECLERGNLLMQWQDKVKKYREENPSVNEPARTRSGAIYEAPQGRTQAAYDPVQSVTPWPVRQDHEDTTEPPVPELQASPSIHRECRSRSRASAAFVLCPCTTKSVRSLLASLEILAQSMVCQTDTTLRSGCGAKAIVEPTTIAAA
ncbi:hypothetical protein HFD88_001986 [Aspergillus terreus]|nr:hypothetical protein HFD88_001986 [Aspergillus terreus]